ncbi:HAMP domain-containing histidine kinase [Bacillus sp. HMF5848]|uniref:two-component system histidine kinase PnpS n=1 Tax=Bacillus sp. HMF5848 TaxID=2495421 RepID=UPI000F7A79AF|nr:ATP-binding protein [Bacillus sp. HMF5848]RSK28127.1 HAMP domain-containing histidine kinase [Bacillus sp. HMF5848]
MNRFRTRLLVTLITLILFVLIALGFLLGQLYKNFYLDTYKDRLEKEVELVAEIIDHDRLKSTALHTELKKYSKMLYSNLFLFDNKGNVLLKTKPSNKKMEEHHNNLIKSMIDSETDIEIVQEKDGTFYYGAQLLSDNGDIKGYLFLSTPVESLEQVNRRIWILLSTCLGLALIVILFLATRITNQYTRPIESATKVAMELARGNYNARTYENHIDETGMLSQSINILARNLQDMTKAQEMQQDRLKTLIENMGSGLVLIDGRGYINLVNRAFKEIFDIDPVDYLYKLYYNAFTHTEVVQLIEEIFMTEVNTRRQLLLPLKIERKHFDVYGAPIIGTNDEWKGIVIVFHDITELKKLEQMRKDFVANVSHELKTPITSIKGFSETLLDGAMKDEATLEYFLSIILKESDRLQTLIQDLLELSKIEQQGFKLNIDHVNIQEVLEDIFVILKSKAEYKEIDLNLNLEKKHLFIKGDTYRIKQVFINLINNAITYTPSGGKVMVNVSVDANDVIIAVSDTGIGILKEEIPRIFERFYRVDKARSRNSGGTGLGLAIVKHLVEAHGGTITVDSRTGGGTTFTVKFKKDIY